MRRTILIALITIFSICIFAVPARRGGRQITQSDGSVITIFQHGDEHFHWLTNDKGEWIRKNTEGIYEVVSSLSESEIATRRAQSPKRIAKMNRSTESPEALIHGLVILVNFKDKTFITPKSEMDSMHMGQNYTRNYSYSYYGSTISVTSTGSVRKYFEDASNGKYKPQFDVVGPVNMSQNMSYYGCNDSNGNDLHPEQMVKEACELADQAGVDFSIYDNDEDGYVDYVYVIYAGYGEADGGEENTIWPHSWYLTSAGINLQLDGKYVDLYACGCELSYYSKLHDGIGTFCHEFSHVLGLPDVYETTGNGTWKTSGEWDIMDYGPYNNDGNTPPTYSGYERWFMGWATPTVLSASGDYTLHELSHANEIIFVTTSGQHNLNATNPNPSTFWVLENRQQAGWDEYIPGHGMMITKIQYNATKWDKNTVNNTRTSLGIDIIEADGSAPNYNEDNPSNGWFGKAKDLFPAGAVSYSGIVNYPISLITENNQVITFKVKSSGEGTQQDTISHGSGDCSDYAYTFTNACKVGTNNLGDISWNTSVENATYINYDTDPNLDRGAQYGSKNNPAKVVSLKTSDLSNCLIKSVTINACMGSNGDAQLSVLLNGKPVGRTQNLTNSPANYEFTNTQRDKGELEIRLQNTEKAMYIKSITITFDTTSTNILSTPITTQEASKILENGQIVILKNGVKYSISGTQL